MDRNAYASVAMHVGPLTMHIPVRHRNTPTFPCGSATASELPEDISQRPREGTNGRTGGQYTTSLECMFPAAICHVICSPHMSGLPAYRMYISPVGTWLMAEYRHAYIGRGSTIVGIVLLLHVSPPRTTQCRERKAPSACAVFPGQASNKVSEACRRLTNGRRVRPNSWRPTVNR